MPTTFSIALPAMATMTRPANAWEIPRASMAGSRATTNQSDTSAAARLAAPSRVRANHNGHRGASPCAPDGAATGDASVPPSDAEALVWVVVDDRAPLLAGRAFPPADRPPGRAVMILLRSRSGSGARFSAE